MARSVGGRRTRAEIYPGAGDWRAARIDGDCAAHSAARACGNTAGEGGDVTELGQPALVDCLTGGVRIFVGDPEGAAIGIERHRAVVAPTRAGGLRCRTGEERLFGLTERINWIRCQSTRVFDR